MEIVKLKCPKCGKVLKADRSKIESANKNKATITCSACRSKSPLREFKIVEDKPEDATRLVGSQTILGSKQNIIGKLHMGKDLCFELKEGRNVVGRKSVNGPHADIELPVEGKRMSRDHIVIEVKNVTARGYVHYVSLNKEKVNATYVGNERLKDGDCVELNDGDLIRLPDANLTFELPDNDKTILDA